MSATTSLTSDLQRQVLLLEDDLRKRVEADSATRSEWVAEHDRALAVGRTSYAWQTWRDDRVTQAAVAWVLATVFVRFCEDNRLVDPVWLAGPPERRQEALDAELAFYREASRTRDDVTAREWLKEAVQHFAMLPATVALVDRHSALRLIAPSGDAARTLLAFWRERGDDGELVHDLTDPELDTRFLGDLYQDLSAYAKATFALLQTPIFVEEFILDRTLEPALADRPLEGFKMIDPTCGSGHFLLGAFARLLDRWQRHAPGLEKQALVQEALDAVHGVDLNPFAVAIARFRLTVAALRACSLRSLESAPAFQCHLAVGDSLLHGAGQQTLVGDTDLSAFAYVTEDVDVLRTILRDSRYDAVVGNPPYIQVKDKTLNQAYRARYDTCSGKYALTVPFMERFFSLAKLGVDDQPAGWVGQITSNSFMKREFGKKLIEAFLAARDVRLVVDTSGAYIPGHGTPTVILIGRNQPPVGPTVRAVLGVLGEPERPADPATANVWSAVSGHVDEPGWDDRWVTVADLPRASLATHPWSLSGGGAVELHRAIEGDQRRRLGAVAHEIGIMAVIGEEEAFEVRPGSTEPTRPMALGDGIRDFSLASTPRFWPYGDDLKVTATALGSKAMWPFRRVVSGYLMFGKTRSERGLEWLEYGMLARAKMSVARSIAFAFVATHNHFVLDSSGTVFNRSAPVIKLPPAATEDQHLALLGVLNSSVACFWLKQNSQDKGNRGGERSTGRYPWESYYEFTSTTLADFPLPSRLPLEEGRQLDALAQRLASHSPSAVMARDIPTAEALSSAQAESARLRVSMIAVQEELDWRTYHLYGLVEEDLTYKGDDLPAVELGERAFEIALARTVVSSDEETAWFVRHGSTPITELPSRWPPAYAALVQRRLNLIATDPSTRLLEKPEYKRRWSSEPWEKQQEQGLRVWLLDRLEDRRFWFDAQGRPTPRSVAELADGVARDADLVAVLALWEGRPDSAVTQSLLRLLNEEAVPFLAAYRYKDSGLRKREAWEATWALQRREDARERVGTIPLPPRYTSADFRKASYWQARGKLDVPKERFVLYPGAGRDTDPTPLLGWAGWNHAQQSLALSLVIGQREAEGWDDARLVPLVAGLAELQPWVAQWHSEVDPAFGVSLAAFCREQLASRASQVGMTLAELADWRPEPATRGRRQKATN